MPDAVIVAAARTPIGRALKGSLVDVHAGDLGAIAIRGVLDQVPAVDPATIDDVVVGAANLVADQNWLFARIVTALAGLPDTVPGINVSRGCASSLEAIRIAAEAVKAGSGDTYLAVGVEQCSHTNGKGIEMADLHPRLFDKTRDDFLCDMYLPMGITAEKVAKRFGVTRERMDEFAKLSHDRAVAAQQAGFFDREIVPVPLPDGTLFTKDECPRPNASVESLAALSPSFKKDGVVTAGNSCPLNDGGAAVMVMSEERAHELGLQPLVRIRSWATTGLAPEIMGVGPIEAVRKALEQAKMTLDDVDVVELNEAFASQVLAVCDELGIDIDEQLNPHGGAIALGHPFGMTGARIMTTLINDLQTLDKEIGVETMCVGTGMGVAMVVERMS
ncbi:MAG TPA: acetyl-CoA C-acyltransferase [Acidimicrobiales bacterium]|nr:acetyl-CoA C-acyltransferase [Acidimicrobiales bacterium]